MIYKEYEKLALKYYDPEGVLCEYRFKMQDALSLLDVMESNNEILTGIAAIENPSEHEYGNPDSFFITDNLLRDNTSEFIKNSYQQARDFISKVGKTRNKIYFEIGVGGKPLFPV